MVQAKVQKRRGVEQVLAVALAILLAFSGLTTTAYADDSTTDDSTAQDSTTDDFGITMEDWSEEDEAEAEASAPLGTYGSKTTLITRSELYISGGWETKKRAYVSYDWNDGDDGLNSLINGISSLGVDDYYAAIVFDEYGMMSGLSGMTTENVSYRFSATAAMDLYNTGKDEYVATLAFSGSKSSSKLSLFVTDTDGNTVATSVTVYSGDNIKQLADAKTHQTVGTIAVAAGDFDGDGYDTIIVYVPAVNNSVQPYITEYKVEDGKLVEVDRVQSSIFTNLLDLNGMRDLDEHDLENQPVVSLVAEDTDRDGIDELVVTVSMNDVDSDNQPKDNSSSAGNLGSRLFIYDYVGTEYEGSNDAGWYQSFSTELVTTSDATASSDDRIVWASATVGNMIASTDSSSVDYPEILAAGFVDGDAKHNGWSINVDSSDTIGAVLVQVDDVEDTYTIEGEDEDTVAMQGVVCSYKVTMKTTVEPNTWTQEGHYESEDCNSLLSVVAFADQGSGEAESVFISGTVYSVSDSTLTELYTPDYFTKDYGSNYTNAEILSAVAGNFDGNDEGREQIICATGLKWRSYNDTTSQLYLFYRDSDSSEWGVSNSGYIVCDAGKSYITLNAVDTDDDSTIATLKDIEYNWSEPDVLAILEASPYFEELDDGDIGNSATTYGTSSTSGENTTTSFGYSAGIVAGYEADFSGSGFGFEATLENSYTWEFASSTEVTWSIEYSNDTGENLVVIYRIPVVSYLYITDDGEEIVISKHGELVTSLVTVDKYNAVAEDYGLEKITEDVVDLADPGDPFSYRSNAASLGTDYDIYPSPDGWVQYYNSGTVTQGIEVGTETESSFSTELSVEFQAFAKVFGVKAGVTGGYTTGSSTSTLNGTSVSKSGAVTGKQYENYDFQWRFVTWFADVNENTIPVLGYLVQNQEAPPSPAQNLTVNNVTQDTIELTWESGSRVPDQYYIYRALDTGGYTLIGTVDGSTTEYTVTGLNPDTIYTYVVRGASYDNDTGSAVVSVDSASASARTLSEDALNVEIVLSGPGEDGVLSSDGSSASIRAQVYAFNAISVSYQWQMRVPGVSAWTDLGDGTNHDYIGVISGANAPTLTLEDLDPLLDGAALRCVVTVPTSDGSPQLYYSDIVPLSVERRATTTSLSVNGSSDGEVIGSGTIDDPYTGYASYTTTGTQVVNKTVFQPVTVEYEDTEYDIYSYGEDDDVVYVGVAYDSEGEASYYVVTVNNDGNYVIGDALTSGGTSWMHDDNDNTVEYPETLPNDFDGEAIVEESSDDGDTVTRYIKTYLFEDNKPTTEYWMNASNGNYYTRTELDGNVSYVSVDPQPDSDEDDIREVYLGSTDTLLIVDAADNDDAVDDNDRYELYERSGGSWVYKDTIWEVTDSGLYKSGESEPYADSFDLTQVLKESVVSSASTTATKNDGTELSLVALTYVGEGEGELVETTMTYLITDISTGGTTTLTAASGQTVTWSASTAGLYRITATAKATSSTSSSSDTVYYYIGAVGDCVAETEYRLVMRQDSDQVTNIQYNGKPVSLSLERRTSAVADEDGIITTAASNWELVEDDVSYTVTFDDEESSNISDAENCVVDAAGTYGFAAYDSEDEQLASAYLTVSKVAISVAPTWTEEDMGTSGLPPSIDYITISVTEGELVAQDQELLNDALEISSDLYGDDGSLSDDTDGTFSVDIEWATDDQGDLTEAAETIRSRYEVTRESDVLQDFSSYIDVSFSSGENGGISGSYYDGTGSELSLGTGSGSSVLHDYDLKFTAAANSGYAVDTWSINGLTIDADTEGVSFAFSDRVMEIDLDAYLATLDEEERSSLHVSVSFAGEGSTIEFGVSGYNGEISAVTGEGNSVTSGQSVAYNTTVTFTATPDEGYMVDYWIVDDEIYTWEGTDSRYREDTLTLENISADHTVYVAFVEEAFVTVQTDIRNANGSSLASAASISVADINGNNFTADGSGAYTVKENAALVFTVDLSRPSVDYVEEWQYSTDGETWSAIAGSGGLSVLTMYNLPNYTSDDGTLTIRVVVNSAQTYTLTYKIQKQDTYGNPIDLEDDDDIASLVVTSENGTALASGDSIPAYTSISFRLILDSGYQVVEWKNTDDGGTSTSREASIASLEKDTEVIVIIAEKASTDDDEATGDEEETSDASGVSELLATDSLSAYMQGWDDGTFAPEQDMSRAEVAQVFYNLLRDKNVEIKSFPDVDESEWYYEAVGVLGTLGIVEGIDGNFEPDRSITRAEFVTIAMRFAKTVEDAECYFSDVEEDAWYYEYVAGAYSYGWVEGYTEDNTFRPDNSITRAEAVCLVNRLLGRSIEEGYELNITRTFSDVPTDHWGYDQIMLATNELVYTVASTDE